MWKDTWKLNILVGHWELMQKKFHSQDYKSPFFVSIT